MPPWSRRGRPPLVWSFSAVGAVPLRKCSIGGFSAFQWRFSGSLQNLATRARGRSGVKLIKLGAVAAGALAAGAIGASPAAAAGPAAPASHSAASATNGGWGNAREVPGSAALNTGGSAGVHQVSCGSAGNCVAAGSYAAGGHAHPFVTEEKNGTWGKAHAIPGVAVLSGGRGAGAHFVSCTSAGNCAVAGTYADAGGAVQWFAADEKNGAWQSAIKIPGLAKLATAHESLVNSLSCASAGNCAVAGSYRTTDNASHAFVADEKNFTWQRAIEVPGIRALNSDSGAEADAVSCASAGNCAVAGSYNDPVTNNLHAFVDDESGGTWGQGHAVPGADTLGPGEATAVSCASAGNCAVTGDYTDSAFSQQVFVADETGGTWGPAQALPGLAAQNVSGHAEAVAISCPAPGNCATGGTFSGLFNLTPDTEAYVADERQGSWDLAAQVFGPPPFNNGSLVPVLRSLSCGSVGNCAAGGSFATQSIGFPVYVVNEVNGSWGNAIQLPGIVALNKGLESDVSSISCPSPGNCAVGGFYTDANGHDQAFVANQTTAASAAGAAPAHGSSP